MESRKVSRSYLAAMVFAWVISQMAFPLAVSGSAGQKTASGLVIPRERVQPTKGAPRECSQLCCAKPDNRAKSLEAIVSHLGLSEGSVVADIGAGGGRDTWVFAKIVGEAGTVFAEEIVEGKVKWLEEEAKKRNLSQVRAVLGRTDDPCLPRNSVDMAFLNHVYHHLAKPREMLQGIWRSLKPGGYLVVVDRERGTLRNWVRRSLREKQHFWTAETTVVREAREEGFAFTACAEQCWYTKDNFVLIFQRPKELASPGSDPDPFLAIPVEKCSHLFLPLACPYQKPVFVALGEARKLMVPILENSSGEGLEIVLEEWATQKEERPPLPSGVSLPSVLTENGDPGLPAESIDVVFFLDSYHLLFHGKTLLAKIRERLAPNGCVYVLDRTAEEPLPRREASHRKKIPPRTVRQEMIKAGFVLWFRGPRPARDRFLLVFGRAQPEDILPEDDPFVAGPLIPEAPGRWLRRNHWRLRGLKTNSGEVVRLRASRWKESLESVASGSPSKEIWKIPQEKLVLYFEEKNQEYLLTGFRSQNGQ